MYPDSTPEVTEMVFQYHTVPGDEFPDNQPRRMTVALLELQWDSMVPATQKFLGFAICNPKDQYVKSKGRKFALRDALTTIPREQRPGIWDQIWATGMKKE